MYPAALSVGLLGPTVFAARAVPALASALALLPLYWVARVSFGPAVALVAAALYAVMYWPLHLARIAFPVGAWPLPALLAVAMLVQAVRRRRPIWWPLAGGAVSLGLYVYPAHSAMVLVLVLFVGLDLVWRWRCWTRRDLVNLAAYGAGFLLVALPLLLYVADPRNDYVRVAPTRSSLLAQQSWQAREGPLDRATLLVARYGDYWRELCCQPNGDTVDGTGLAPVAPLALLGLVLVGVLLAGRRRCTPLLVLSSLVVLLLPFGAILTTGSYVRRTLVVAPLLALLASLGAVELWRLARPAGRRLALTVALGLVGLLAMVTYNGLDTYFVQWPRSELRRWTFAEEFHDAVLFLRQLPPDSQVYFYSERWSFNYEPRRFLAADVAGEDRSTRFGGDGRVVRDAVARPVFIFLGEYRALLDETRERYPGGVLHTVGRPDNPSFEAYVAPVQPR